MFSGLNHWISIESFLKRKQEKSVGVKQDNEEDLAQNLSSPVKEYMSTRLITAEPENTVDEVGRLLVQNKVNRIPIVVGKNIVGIITRGDILKAINIKLADNW